MIDYLPLVLTGIGIMASILYYSLTLRNSNNIRQSQLFMQAHARFQDTEFTKMYNEVMPDTFRFFKNDSTKPIRKLDAIKYRFSPF